MFFVSEEFLRKYEQGEEFVQTIDEAVKPGEGLFEQTVQVQGRFERKTTRLKGRIIMDITVYTSVG